MALDIHRFTSEEYDALIDSGALEDLNVELIDGLVLDMSPQGDEHAWVIHTIQRAFDGRADLMVRVQTTLRLGDGSSPEPDIAVIDLPPGARAPLGAIHLAAEVAVSSHARDRRKAGLYARSGVRRYWIVDIPGECVIDHADPGPDGYREVTVRTAEDALDTGLDGVDPLTVARIFEGLR